MKKMLRIEMPDGSVWHADALFIAEDRADYYATKVDSHERGSEEWQGEVDYALKDISELADWAVNNMDWPDLKAVQVTPPSPPDYNSLWLEAEFDLVDD